MIRKQQNDEKDWLHGLATSGYGSLDLYLAAAALGDRPSARVRWCPRPCSSGLSPCHFLACGRSPLDGDPGWLSIPLAGTKSSPVQSARKERWHVGTQQADLGGSNQSEARKMATSQEILGRSGCVFGWESRPGEIAQLRTAHHSNPAPKHRVCNCTPIHSLSVVVALDVLEQRWNDCRPLVHACWSSETILNGRFKGDNRTV